MVRALERNSPNQSCRGPGKAVLVRQGGDLAANVWHVGCKRDVLIGLMLAADAADPSFALAFPCWVETGVQRQQHASSQELAHLRLAVDWCI